MVTYGSLFSGIGGMDLGLDWAGLRGCWQVELDPSCRTVLQTHWPDVPKYADVRGIINESSLEYVDVICGGDPCPVRSRARSNGASLHPDLSGYFLALVGRLRPRWVVRENVPAPDDVWFDASLAMLGYGTVIVRMDAAKVTGQSRQRDFIIGCHQVTRQELRKLFHDCESGPGKYTTRLGTRQIVSALTTNRTRYDSRDCYIYESTGLRILDADEREAFAGFPTGWTAGFSEAKRTKFYGNTVVPQLVEWLGRRIIAHDKH